MNLPDIYNMLLVRFGQQGWWPGETAQEHLTGCILAQNTRWDRVEPVIGKLKDAHLLQSSRLLDLAENELAEMLRGTGTYRRKAQYLQTVWEYMAGIGWDGTPGSVNIETSVLREELLSLKGIGPETCDCILLYVLERPVFVVDTYTKRVLARHGFCSEKDSYSFVQELFHNSFELDTETFGEFHALLVACAKEYCRPVAKCVNCPLNERTGWNAD